MSKGILVFAEHRDGALNKTSFEAMAAAQSLASQLQQEVVAFLVGSGVQNLAGEIAGYDVITSITGPLTQPVVNVRSDPALPQADVVSLILNGQLSTGETGTSALAQSGLGTAASLLTESLISAPARRATNKLFGLNRLEIDPLIAGRGGESPTARLTVGRQINKNLSITYSTNVTGNQNQVLAVEYRVSNRLSFIAQYEQGSTTGFNSRNDNFSFEIRLRKRF